MPFGVLSVRPKVLTGLYSPLGSARLSGARPMPLSPVTWPATTPLLVIRARIALGADLFADPATWQWQEITEWVRYTEAIQVVTGRQDEASIVNTSQARLTLENDGRFSRRNPTGPWYGLLTKNTPIWLELDPGDGMHTIFEGFVNEWPARWRGKLKDAIVPIACAGVLRRLQAGGRTMSPLRRTLLASDPIAYWPLEDDADSANGASAVGGQPITASGTITWAGQTDLAGSIQAPTTSAGGLYGAVTGGSSTAWHVEIVVKGTFSAGSLGRIYTNSSGVQAWRLVWPPDASGDIGIIITDSAGSITGTVAGSAVGASWENTWHHVAVTAAQSGADIAVRVYVDGSLTATGTVSAQTLGAVSQVWGNHLTLAGIVGMGHIAVGDGTTISGAADAVDGYQDEQAHVRIARLCTQEGVPYYSVAGSSVSLGIQPTTDFVSCLRDAERADHGTLYEKGWGLAYQSRAERENAPVALTLNFAGGHIAEDPEPADDDQRTRNVWTVSRPGGAEAAYEKTDGPLGTDTIDVWDDSASINVAADSLLPTQAGYLVHIGTVDEDRWPKVELKLQASPDLIPALPDLPYGARIQMTNPPAEVAPDTIDAVVEGSAVRVDQFSWYIALVTSPNSPNHVFRTAELTGDTDVFVGYLTPTTCVLAEDLDTTETAVDITTDPLWSTDADDWTPGARIRVGGEVMTVTAVSGGSNPQTLTVTRSVNGVTKTHSSGAEVEFDSPGVLAL